MPGLKFGTRQHERGWNLKIMVGIKNFRTISFLLLPRRALGGDKEIKTQGGRIMFKLTNSQLIQIAAVDAGLDPFAEYCTRGMWKSAGYAIRTGEKPVLVLELWCPRQSKDQGETLSSEAQQGETSGASAGLFFQFKTCHLYTRSQVISAEELAQEKEAKKIRKQMEKQFKAAVMAQGGIKPSEDYDVPQWCRRRNGAAIDEAVAEVAAAGFPVQDANSLFDMLQAI
jgi:hypothetical protein